MPKLIASLACAALVVCACATGATWAAQTTELQKAVLVTGASTGFAAADTPAHDRLARIKGEFDPGNQFRLNSNIEPA